MQKYALCKTKDMALHKNRNMICAKSASKRCLNSAKKEDKKSRGFCLGFTCTSRSWL